MASHGVSMMTVNPVQVRALAQTLRQRAKSDPLDATVIARFAEATLPQSRPLPDGIARLLNNLMTHRRQIVEMIASERQRLHRAEPPRVRKSIEQLLKALQRELGSIDGDIGGMVRSSPIWRAKENLPASVLHDASDCTLITAYSNAAGIPIG